jgi:hypothetical protein
MDRRVRGRRKTYHAQGRKRCKAFPTTSTVRTKKSELRLICEKDPSPLPHWKLSGTMCRQPSHTTRVTCTSERKTNGLVRRLRDTGRVADRPRRGCPRVMMPHQDRAIRLAHLRNRHVTATETALTMVGIA